MNERKTRGVTRRAFVAASAALLAGARPGEAGDPDYTPIWETPSPVVIGPGGTGEMDLTLGTTGEVDEPATAQLSTTMVSQQDPQDLPPELPGSIPIAPEGGGGGGAAQQSQCQPPRRGKGRGKARLRRRRSQKGRIVIDIHATIRGFKTAKPLRVIISP